MDSVEKKNNKKSKAEELALELYKEYRLEGLNHLEALERVKRTMACFKEVDEV